MKRLASVVALFALSLGSLSIPLSGRAAYAPAAEGGKLAVATDNPEATRAALSLLDRGGNAVDGAIAAALALGVVGPSSSGIGGGGFALVYTAKDRQFNVVDFRETAPEKIDADALFAREKRGPSVGVPGEPAGLEFLAKKYGKKTLAEDASPAVTLAEKGFFVGKHFRDGALLFRDRVKSSTHLTSLLYPNGSPISLGARVTRADLAKALRAFGAGGSRALYTGRIAEAMVAAVRAEGGSLAVSDLTSYKVRERKPLVRTIDGRTIATMPAPSAGGMMVLETLSMFGANRSSSLASMGAGSSATYHMLGEAMRGALADRVRLVGDPDLDPRVNDLVDDALAPNQIAARKKKIDPNKTHKAPEFQSREQGTTHLIVADAEGNVVSLTTTVNAPFGATIVAGDTGIVMNDEMDDFSAPKDVEPFGVDGGGPNRPRPLARPVSSMCPTIVLENGEPILALGGSGGQRIATGVTQVAVNRLIFGLDASTSVSMPRVHVGASREMIVERDVADDVRQGLIARGEQLKDETFGAPAVQIVTWERGGLVPRIFAASDPRKSGFSAAK